NSRRISRPSDYSSSSSSQSVINDYSSFPSSSDYSSSSSSQS
ncbi:hypothetical protein NPIL_646321, partial [Nephila pilipes]